MTLTDILNKFREMASNTTQQGETFEKFMRYVFLNAVYYKDIIEKVWRWKDFPYNGNKHDYGIDLVAKTVDGDYWAIQCKFYDFDSVIGRAQIDTFLSASAAKFKDSAGKEHTYKNRIIVATCDLTESLKQEMGEQIIPTEFLHVLEKLNTEDCGIDWTDFWKQFRNNQTVKVSWKRRELRDHQKAAFDDVIKGFREYDRGKLVMACGTGKTLTSLRITEKIVPHGGLALYLVPSLSLLGQTLSAWTLDAAKPIRPILVCSDTTINNQESRQRKKQEDAIQEFVSDLALPATTKAKEIVERYNAAASSRKGVTVVFSTYQSLQAVVDAQKKGLPEFDLVVCDEAHRTTGYVDADDPSNASAFTLVHENKNIKAKKRLYMTATPKIYGNSVKNRLSKMKDEGEGCGVLYSMDDETKYGPEFHKLSFGDAVKQDLLSDYKVIVLTVSQQNIQRFSEFEKWKDFSNEDYRALNPKQLRNIKDDEIKELKLNALAQLFGCWQGLAKQGKYIGDDKQLTDDFDVDPSPMHRAVAFAPTVNISRDFIKPSFENISNVNLILQKQLRQQDPNFKEPTLRLEVDHIDGTIVANKRAMKLNWLEEDAGNETCRILTNVRCLSEGVDVPALDAVIFLSPKNSKIDIIQSVGRVMRKAEGKKYGYIILPIAVPESADPKTVLDDNDRFQVVWDVLQALRSHDERLRIEINKIRFNELPDGFDPATADLTALGGGTAVGDEENVQAPKSVQSTILFPGMDNGLKTRIKAKIVKNCGDRFYLEDSADTVANIAKGHIDEIKKQLRRPTPAQDKAFDRFVKKLQNDINPAIDREQAIEMISQHLVIQPVFDALFKDYQFVQKNVISQAFEQLLNTFNKTNTDEENEKLRKIREDIESLVSGIIDLKSKQRVITTLYDRFFKRASQKTADKFGIVYTPVEVVDFIIHSVEQILLKEFGKSMNNKNVHILDPFTGTGTFIVQLLQSGIIKPDSPNFAYKFNNELHANEIVLLAYYIAAINIEETFHMLGKRDKYTPFPGLVLTDTFQMFEKELPEKANMPITVLGEDNADEVENNERIIRQRKADIQVIIGNPPYSVGQNSANDNNQNQKYPKLDKRVEETYVEKSSANLRRGLYDSYIKAFRWASDRIGDKGVIGFITNNGWIEKNTMDGFRKCLTEEFTSVYVFNLRGAVKGRSGVYAKKEGASVFNIMTGVAIVILVKNPEKARQDCQIFYHDIGDYLNRHEKLNIIKRFHDISRLPLQTITPNEHGDWINQRGEVFPTFFALGDKKGEETELPAFFEPIYSPGLATARDSWVYNFSTKELVSNMKRMISFYNQQVLGYGKYIKKRQDATVEEFIDTDPTKISWTRALRNALNRLQNSSLFNSKDIRVGYYRPFCKSNLYWNKFYIESPGLFQQLFPTPKTDNLVICIEAPGARRDFTCMITSMIPDYHVMEATQCFPLYYYTPEGEEESSLFGGGKGKVVDGYVRHDAVTDAILDRAREKYGYNSITKQDLFYYVYGFLHSPEYREQFAADLKRSLARIPLVKSYIHFKEFAAAGEKLAELHLNYDSPARLKAALNRINKSVRTPFLPVRVNRVVDRSQWKNDEDVFHLDDKMRFGKKNKQEDKSVIVYNECVTIKDVPLDAYNYVVNGKSAIEWVMERYQVKTDAASQITNDPNLWEDGENPKYIVELLESVITVSVNTMKIVNSLPQDWEA